MKLLFCTIILNSLVQILPKTNLTVGKLEKLEIFTAKFLILHFIGNSA